MPRIRLSHDEIGNLVNSLFFLAEVIEPVPVIEDALRDKADLPILGTFLAARADYLITGDKDLLALAGRYPILAPAEFWASHGG
jgi:putative PIN family toxin of toxin-antitoxin system